MEKKEDCLLSARTNVINKILIDAHLRIILHFIEFTFNAIKKMLELKNNNCESHIQQNQD